MKKTAFYCIFVILLCLVSCEHRNDYITCTGYAQGGTFTVKANLEGVKESPEKISSAIDSILNTIDFTLSGYNKKSILSQYNEGLEVKANKMFVDIFEKSCQFWEETSGSFDIAAGDLFDIWGFGFTTDSLPPAETVARTLENCGMKTIRQDMAAVETEYGNISRRNMGRIEGSEAPKLNFNAIAQGYSCDAVADYLHSIGVKDMLVDIGEIYCEGLNSAGRPWSIGIDRPTDGNNNPGEDITGIWTGNGEACGIVTSGNYRKFYIRDGKKYSHTIDPRSGYPVNHNLLSATIVAPDATTADAIATYCMVIGLEEARDYITSKPELEGYLVYEEDSQMKVWASDGFRMRL